MMHDTAEKMKTFAWMAVQYMRMSNVRQMCHRPKSRFADIIPLSSKLLRAPNSTTKHFLLTYIFPVEPALTKNYE